MSTPTLANGKKHHASVPFPIAENTVPSNTNSCCIPPTETSTLTNIPSDINALTSPGQALPPSLRFLGMPSRSLRMLQQASDPTRKNSQFNAQVASTDRGPCPDPIPDRPVSRSFSESSVPAFKNSDLSTRPLRHVRKKSGELVKLSLKDEHASRMHSRSRSLPTTPTEKQVHFGYENDVCYFKKKDKPLAISATNSPTSSAYALELDDESDTDLSEVGDIELGPPAVIWEIQLVNFPLLSMEKRLALGPSVIFEDIFVSDQKTVVGHIAVKNIAFEKAVHVRYSLDGWATIIEQPAFYTSQRPVILAKSGYDRFTFQVNVEKMFEGMCLNANTGCESKDGSSQQEFQLCVKYVANSREYWDNNNQINYRFVIIRSLAHHKKASSKPLDLHCVKPKYTSRQRRRNSADTVYPLKSESDAAQTIGKPAAEHNDFVLNGFYMSSPLFTSLHSTVENSDLEFRNTRKPDSNTEPRKAPDINPAHSSSFASGPLKVNYQDTFNSQSYQEFLNRFCFFSPTSSSGGDDFGNPKPSDLSTSTSTSAPKPKKVSGSCDRGTLEENDRSQHNSIPEPHTSIPS